MRTPYPRAPRANQAVAHRGGLPPAQQYESQDESLREKPSSLEFPAIPEVCPNPNVWQRAGRRPPIMRLDQAVSGVSALSSPVWAARSVSQRLHREVLVHSTSCRPCLSGGLQ